MSYWLKWDWEHQCNFCKKRKNCANKPRFENSIKNIKKVFNQDPATVDASLTIECNKFSVDQRKYDEYVN